MVVLDVLGLAVGLLALGLFTGAYVAVLWSPFLLLTRLRPLFRVGPTDRWWLNYAVAALLAGLVHATVYAVGRALLADLAAPELLLYAGLGTAVLWMAVAGVGLPSVGRNWKTGGYMTELVLLGGAVWYALVTTVPPLFLHSVYLAD